jgi:hypothetical protein
MNPFKSLVILPAALLVLAVSASANIYNATNHPNVDINEGQTVTGQWTYSLGAGETVVSVESWFNFESSDSDREKAEVKVGVGEGVVDQSRTTSFTNFGTLYTVHFDASSLQSLLDDASNGILSYSVTATNVGNVQNDFTFTTASVKVTTRSVPEGGATLTMLGLTLVGFVGFQRKFRLAR